MNMFMTVPAGTFQLPQSEGRPCSQGPRAYRIFTLPSSTSYGSLLLPISFRILRTSSFVDFSGTMPCHSFPTTLLLAKAITENAITIFERFMVRRLLRNERKHPTLGLSCRPTTKQASNLTND